MTRPEEVARAIAFFEASDDLRLLRGLLAEIAPRARRMIESQVSSGGEDSIPPPAKIEPAARPAAREEALATLRSTVDLALLQAMSRAIGRRVEALQAANGGGRS